MTLMAVNCQDKIFIAMDDYLCFEGLLWPKSHCRLWSFHIPVNDQYNAFFRDTAQFSSVQSLSCVRLFATPWIAACQASLSITISRSSLKLMSIELVMPSSRLILCRPLRFIWSEFKNSHGENQGPSGLYPWDLSWPRNSSPFHTLLLKQPTALGI